MAKNSNTAERELLKAIEGHPNVQKMPSAEKSGIDFISLLKSRLSFFADAMKKPSKQAKPALSLTIIANALIGLIVMLIIWYGVVIMGGMRRFERIPRFETSEMPRGDVSTEIHIPLRDYAFYADALLGRNIFIPFVEKEPEREITTSRINDMVQGLKLAGISWSPDSHDRYAMIEDAKTQLTYFLQENDMFLNLVVKEINEESIVLGFGSEEIELR